MFVNLLVAPVCLWNIANAYLDLYWCYEIKKREVGSFWGGNQRGLLEFEQRCNFIVKMSQYQIWSVFSLLQHGQNLTLVQLLWQTVNQERFFHHNLICSKILGVIWTWYTDQIQETAFTRTVGIGFMVGVSLEIKTALPLKSPLSC